MPCSCTGNMALISCSSLQCGLQYESPYDFLHYTHQRSKLKVTDFTLDLKGLTGTEFWFQPETKILNISSGSDSQHSEECLGRLRFEQANFSSHQARKKTVTLRVMARGTHDWVWTVHMSSMCGQPKEAESSASGTPSVWVSEVWVYYHRLESPSIY